MAKEAKFVNKNLYKLELYSAKVVPMLMAGITLANTILSFTGEVKAFTVSEAARRTSVVGFNYHKTIKDYINSIVHEAEHVKQHMLKAYLVADKDEPPAYTMGFLASKMLMFFLKMIQK